MTGNLIEYKWESKTKKTLLNEKDDLWMQFRHKHIADVLTGLKEYVDDIKKRNPTAVKLAGGGGGEGTITGARAGGGSLMEHDWADSSIISFRLTASSYSGLASSYDLHTPEPCSTTALYILRIRH